MRAAAALVLAASVRVAAADPAPPNQDEQLAAIQHAMNELAPAAQQCWAVAAAVRFDIDGELTAEIAIAAPPATTGVSLVKDTAHNPQLAACLIKLLVAYRWAPPLHGQTIRLPFAFHAPDAQNVVDRTLVPWAGQAGVSVAVLADRNNTGNAAASMFELAIAAGATTGLRTAPRGELWFFLGAGTISSVAGGTHAVAAGTMMLVPAGGARQVTAGRGDLHAVVVVAPGGAEGAARAGALPTPALTTWRAAPASPVLTVPGEAHQVVSSHPFSESIVEMEAGAVFPVMARTTTLIYVLAGTAELSGAKGSTPIPVPATAVVDLQPDATAVLTARTAVRALVVHIPADR